MRCARCHRNIKRAYVTAGGMVFGPTCGAIMGLVPTVQQTAKTQPMAIKCRANTAFSNGSIQDGQIQLFEGMTA
jgi:LytS/YehU family sensor histidine kinase